MRGKSCTDDDADEKLFSFDAATPPPPLLIAAVVVVRGRACRRNDGSRRSSMRIRSAVASCGVNKQSLRKTIFRNVRKYVEYLVFEREKILSFFFLNKKISRMYDTCLRKRPTQQQTLE